MKLRCIVLILIVAVFSGLLLMGCTSQEVKKDAPAAESKVAGDVAKGKALFEDAKLGGGTSGKSCASCHPGGQGLAGVADKKEFKAMGKTYKTLADATNYFIETAQKGKALDPQSEQMLNLIAYMKSLKK
jgi:mono/diheme cytochrome c family protein